MLSENDVYGAIYMCSIAISSYIKWIPWVFLVTTSMDSLLKLPLLSMKLYR